MKNRFVIVVTQRNAAKNIEREGLSLCGLKVSGCTVLAPRTPLFQ